MSPCNTSKIFSSFNKWREEFIVGIYVCNTKIYIICVPVFSLDNLKQISPSPSLLTCSMYISISFLIDTTRTLGVWRFYSLSTHMEFNKVIIIIRKNELSLRFQFSVRNTILWLYRKSECSNFHEFAFAQTTITTNIHTANIFF